jgi:hypothetical protein
MVAGVAMTVVAQTPATQAPAAPALPGAMVTVVGCLTAGNAAGAPATASRGTAPQYVLTDQAPPAQASGPPEATPSRGATSAGAQKPARRMYVLRSEGDTTDLSKHVNHAVRVTGATTAPMTTAPLAGRSPEATPVTGAAAPPGATGTPFDTTNLPTLVVTNLVMVSATCQ